MRSTKASLVLFWGLGGCIITTGGPSDTDGDSENGSATTAPTTDATTMSTNASADETATSVGSGDGGSANDRCGPFCESLVAAMCENGPTLAGCLLTCEALTSSEICDPTAHVYFDCVEGSMITCNGAGDPVAQGCGLAYLEAIGCAVNEDPNPAVVEPCADYCDAVAAAACPGNGTVDECNTNCLWLGATGTGCGGEWETFLSCANGADISCVLGFAVAEGCGPEFEAYYACIDAAGGG